MVQSIKLKNLKLKKLKLKIKKKKKLKKGKVKQLVLEKKISDEKIAKKEGEYFSEKDFPIIVKQDCDVYSLINGKKQLLGKFRKNVISKKLTNSAMVNLKEAAQKKHSNRGAAAGAINMKDMAGYVKKENMVGNYKFRIKGYYSDTDGKFVNQSIGNDAQSNIIGYFDKPDRNPGSSNAPCRLTAFNYKEMDKSKKVEPFLQRIDKLFKSLTPNAHKKQHKRAHETEFVIKDTAFSTVTINYNWRTALHKDSGDFEDGFGNLIVCEEGKYEGGCTGFPQYGVAFDVRDGDFLAMDVHEWHCNTKIIPKSKDYSRLSVVCYLRKNMLRCKGIKPSY